MDSYARPPGLLWEDPVLVKSTPYKSILFVRLAIIALSALYIIVKCRSRRNYGNRIYFTIGGHFYMP
jgi:hypothetical protein